MSDHFKPEGYTSVSPYVVVEDAQRVIDFLSAVFETTDLRRYERPNGSIMHVEVRLDDTVIMLGEGPDTDTVSAFTSMVHVYVPDVDATYQRALKAGGVSVQDPLQQEDDPDQRGIVEDPEGNLWVLATRIG
ncbi:VOC family protein [Halegenticoccus soli]|uniref:VOC family protein n=1 Tax=Halegenticoccus soli TaxID=1985678 RepID=UPI000C6D8800|nr:VOC family protein [Halegenticoccus soli]